MVNKRYPDAPRVAVGAVIIHQHKVLLVLRGQPPAEGMWAIPGGSVELGETLQVAAEREVREETGLHVKAGEIVYAFDAIQRDESGRIMYHYVILDLLATAADPSQPLVPADDVLDARWFGPNDLDDLELPISATTRRLLDQLLLQKNHD